MSDTKTKQLIIVVTSFPKIEDAQVMAHHLLEKRLAACIQIQKGVLSIFRWEGKVCEAHEVILSAKTEASKWSAIIDHIKSHHPYDIPEIVAFTPAQYDQAYGQWVQAEID